jgi:hypothetical protein
MRLTVFDPESRLPTPRVSTPHAPRGTDRTHEATTCKEHL